MADGKIVIETDLDSSKLESGLSKLKGIASSAAKGIAVGVGAIGTALVGAVGKSVQMAGELEQQLGGTEAVFGNLADTVQNKAVKAFNTMGLSANDFMQTANKMGSLMQGAGLTVEDSMTLSTEAMQRAADVASVMGISTESAMESIAGAAKGNFTMMDNLGVAMNATTIEAYALSKGMKTSYNEMDNATKVGLAMEMFLEKTAKYAGNYAKENETFAGSFSTLKAAIANFMSGAGSIQDVTTAMVDFGVIVTNSIVEMAPQIVNGISTLVKNILPQIPPLLSKILPVIIDGALEIAQSLSIIVPEIIRLITSMLPQMIDMGLKVLLSLVMGIAESLPELVPTIVDTVLLIVETLLDNIDLIIEAGIAIIIGLIDGLIEALPRLIEKAPTIIEKLANAIINNLPKIFNMGGQLIVKLVAGIMASVWKLTETAPLLIRKLVDAFVGLLGSFYNCGKNIVQGIWDGIANTSNWLYNKVKSFAANILNNIKKALGIHSPSRVMRDEVGKYMAQGIGVGFEDELQNVYSEMQNAINLEQGKIQANLQTGQVYNKVYGATPIELTNNNTTTLETDGEVLAKVVNKVNQKRTLQYAF
jgi:phage-related protein